MVLWSTVCMDRHHVTCLKCPLSYKFLRKKPRRMYDVRCCEYLNGQALNQSGFRYYKFQVFWDRFHLLRSRRRFSFLKLAGLCKIASLECQILSLALGWWSLLTCRLRNQSANKPRFTSIWFLYLTIDSATISWSPPRVRPQLSRCPSFCGSPHIENYFQ